MMNKITKIKLFILITVGITFTLFSVIHYDLNFNAKNRYKNSENNERINPDNDFLRVSKYWELTSPIEIDDTGINNWIWAEGEAWFGGGNGTIANPYIIENVNINVDNNFEYCIRIQNSIKYFIIQNCTVLKASQAGISLENVYNSKLIYNNATNNDAYGMEISYSDNNVISNNTANNNGNYGISLAYCDNNTILENTLNSNNENGIDLWISNYNNISGNTANYNNEVGIWLSGNDNNIVENYVENNDITGIYLESSHDNTVSRNTANDNDYGIRLMDSYYNNISGNTVNYNYYGIQLRYSDSNIFSTNNLNNNDYGFHLYYSYENNLSGNIINDNSYSGIWLFYSDDNTITDNTLWENNEGIRLSSSDENNILANNINDNSYRGIHLSNSDNNVISFNIITNNDIGIYLYYSYSNEISNNNFSGNNEDIVEYIYTEPPPSPETIIIVIVVVIIIISICTAMGVYRKRVSRPRTKIFPFEKYRLPEKPIKEITLKHETISELKTPTEVEKLEVAQDELEKPLNIYQLRSKFKNEIEKIREIVHRENFIISLSGIDEIIKSLENLNLKNRREIMDVYLNKLIEYSIRLREEVYKRLINENDVKKANLEINRTEVDLMRMILPIEEIKVSEPEKQPEKVEALQEEEQIISAPIEDAEEVEIIQDEEVISTLEEKPVEEVLLEELPSSLEEIPKEVEILPEEEIVVSEPEEQPKELVPPEPEITNCSFCGLVNDKAAIFCSQCGMVFKKK